jgi:hypothetical protein
MWVIAVNHNNHGNIICIKACCIVRGDKQHPGHDFIEIWASVIGPEGLQVILSTVAQLDLDCIHVNVDSAFLYSPIATDTYVYPPQGFDAGPGTVWKLEKAMYGLHEAPGEWEHTRNTQFFKIGFMRCQADLSIFYRCSGNNLNIIAVYVDDMLLCANKGRGKFLKLEIMDLFDMKDLGPVSSFLGINI